MWYMDQSTTQLSHVLSSEIYHLSPRLCLGVWRGREGKALSGGKYEGKWRNLSKNLKG